MTIVPARNKGLMGTACTMCGECTSVCPADALEERSDDRNLECARRSQEARRRPDRSGSEGVHRSGVRHARGIEGVREAEIDVDGLKVKAAVAHGLTNAREIMEGIKSGRFKDYHFIEIMCCPGGCIGGGGQPYPTSQEIRKKRIEAIYAEDEGMPMRKSHDNPAVKKLYEEFLREPLSHKSHELLHTHYTPRAKRISKAEEKTKVPVK